LPRIIVSKEYLSNSQLEELLKSSSFDKDSIIIKKVEEYLSAVRKCKAENIKEILEELKKLSIPEELAVMIINVLPTESAELRALLPQQYQSLPSETVEKAVEIVSKCF
jgi:DNA-directed RNA polymerase subunit F